MGFKAEFNWALKLSPDNGLVTDEIFPGGVFSFVKDGYRVYPVGIPIDLLDSSWTAIAKAVVVECTTADGKTSGKYKVIRLYSVEEKEILTQNWRETAEYIK